ncbi:hypothetical protein H1C71_023921 [Ictidomys tridecemlineatus]|nr:hypothetical protein H1C71_023921 [Ictidomys tridecemlineatus]KAG3271113.1 hypothetical protein H1C71_023921 [Ictidomys tridecemlineatus]KAG3271114.1 hypothetical protein H1C71_023921 [Ictidomys tridecemlineatus]
MFEAKVLPIYSRSDVCASLGFSQDSEEICMRTVTGSVRDLGENQRRSTLGQTAFATVSCAFDVNSWMSLSDCGWGRGGMQGTGTRRTGLSVCELCVTLGESFSFLGEDISLLSYQIHALDSAELMEHTNVNVKVVQ